MAQVSQADLQKNSVSLDLLSNSYANERFPTLSKEKLATLRSKNRNQNTSRSAKTWLNVFNKCRAQRSEARKLEDILDAILGLFSGNSKNKKTVTNTNQRVWLSCSAGSKAKIKVVGTFSRWKGECQIQEVIMLVRRLCQL